MGARGGGPHGRAGGCVPLRSVVEVVAERVPGTAASPTPRTRLRTLRCDGAALALRRTSGAAVGAAQVHLVGTAAGPMGGDTVEIRLVLGPGAHLQVRGVAASVVLPGRHLARSHLLLDVHVGPGAVLDCELPTVVVTGAAEHEATTSVRLDGDARLRLVEQVRLGRHGEGGGWWRGRLGVTRDGAPVLRQATTLGGPDDAGPAGTRSIRSVLDTAGTAPATACADRVVMPLAAGGTLDVLIGR